MMSQKTPQPVPDKATQTLPPQAVADEGLKVEAEGRDRSGERATAIAQPACSIDRTGSQKEMEGEVAEGHDKSVEHASASEQSACNSDDAGSQEEEEEEVEEKARANSQTLQLLSKNDSAVSGESDDGDHPFANAMLRPAASPAIDPTTPPRTMPAVAFSKRSRGLPPGGETSAEARATKYDHPRSGEHGRTTMRRASKGDRTMTHTAETAAYDVLGFHFGYPGPLGINVAPVRDGGGANDHEDGVDYAVVRRVDPHSPAAITGVRPGDAVAYPGTRGTRRVPYGAFLEMGYTRPMVLEFVRKKKRGKGHEGGEGTSACSFAALPRNGPEAAVEMEGESGLSKSALGSHGSVDGSGDDGASSQEEKDAEGKAGANSQNLVLLSKDNSAASGNYQTIEDARAEIYCELDAHFKALLNYERYKRKKAEFEARVQIRRRIAAEMELGVQTQRRVAAELDALNQAERRAAAVKANEAKERIELSSKMEDKTEEIEQAKRKEVAEIRNQCEKELDAVRDELKAERKHAAAAKNRLARVQEEWRKDRRTMSNFQEELSEMKSFNASFIELLRYRDKNGNCDVPKSYDGGLSGSLGFFVKRLRKWKRQQDAGIRKGAYVSEEQVKLLEAIGFRWSIVSEDQKSWEEWYEELVEYKNLHGQDALPVYATAMGKWICSQRLRYKERQKKLKYIEDHGIEADWRQAGIARKRSIMSQEEIDKLNAIGFTWVARPPQFYWDGQFENLMAYYKENDHCDVPQSYGGGLSGSLGFFVKRLRRWKRQQDAGTRKGVHVSEEQIKQLDAIGFRWRVGSDDEKPWEECYQELIEYKSLHGQDALPEQTTTLGKWVCSQRGRYKERQKKLKYIEEHGSDAGWKQAGTARKWPVISQEEIDKLNAIGFTWMARDGQLAWDRQFEELMAYYKENGHCDVPRSFKGNMNLGAWVSRQREFYWDIQRGKKTKGSTLLAREGLEKLESIGFRWRLQRGRKKKRLEVSDDNDMIDSSQSDADS